jgi:hypothetical protein
VSGGTDKYKKERRAEREPIMLIFNIPRVSYISPVWLKELRYYKEEVSFEVAMVVAAAVVASEFGCNFPDGVVHHHYQFEIG